MIGIHISHVDTDIVLYGSESVIYEISVEVELSLSVVACTCLCHVEEIGITFHQLIHQVTL